MCLITLAYRSVPGYPLVLVANRDEFHNRASTALAWDGDLLAGRDTQAGGTWLGVNRRGWFGAVTNLHNAPTPPVPPSRGHLIPDFLGTEGSPQAFFAGLNPAAYAGFNLLLGNASQLHYCNNCDDAPILLQPGYYGLSNSPLAEPWPKARASSELLRTSLQRADPEPQTLIALLAPDSSSSGTASIREDVSTVPFVRSPHYGTRCTTALLVAADGLVQMAEQRYDTRARPIEGAHVLRFQISPPA